MAVTSEHIAIAELVIYIPVTLVTILVVLRHGFHKQLGWIYLSIFGVIRIAGAIMEILSTNHPDNANDKEWALILQSVGLSPLLLSTLGLLKRIISIFSKRATAISRRSKIVQILHLPALIALILAISGGSDQASSNVSDHAGGKKETQAAIIIFLMIYVITCLLFVITVKDLREMQPSQQRIYICVFFALPLIAVRLLYSLISDFGHDAKFSLIDGDPSVQLGMATIEEFLVVLMYTVLGVITPQSSIDRAVGGGIVAPDVHALEDGRTENQDAYFAQAGARSAYYAK
ncbi:uncharacterized protein N7483_006821 [Penicillium malachiteum]|uniref:uncharacterized protein n=1 Tax=Penicillium malachiteum TaxID=1324776 RepID=UPI002547FDD6|nr:uncharacterized protein N7483_006821 [Penicillium malachiteum]KAJ5725464.1 hypothetical protein N7483_006821 [Penicillium malachiteum]